MDNDARNYDFHYKLSCSGRSMSLGCDMQTWSGCRMKLHLSNSAFSHVHRIHPPKTFMECKFHFTSGRKQVKLYKSIAHRHPSLADYVDSKRALPDQPSLTCTGLLLHQALPGKLRAKSGTLFRPIAFFAHSVQDSTWMLQRVLGA